MEEIIYLTLRIKRSLENENKAITFKNNSIIWFGGVPLRRLKIENYTKTLRENGLDQVEVFFKFMEGYKKRISLNIPTMTNGWQNRKGFDFENEFTATMWLSAVEHLKGLGDEAQELRIEHGPEYRTLCINKLQRMI